MIFFGNEPCIYSVPIELIIIGYSLNILTVKMAVNGIDATIECCGPRSMYAASLWGMFYHRGTATNPFIDHARHGLLPVWKMIGQMYAFHPTHLRSGIGKHGFK